MGAAVPRIKDADPSGTMNEVSTNPTTDVHVLLHHRASGYTAVFKGFWPKSWMKCVLVSNICDAKVYLPDDLPTPLLARDLLRLTSSYPSLTHLLPISYPTLDQLLPISRPASSNPLTHQSPPCHCTNHVTSTSARNSDPDLVTPTLTW
jgi:hypothetical protein